MIYSTTQPTPATSGTDGEVNLFTLPRFDGRTYNHETDHGRLSRQFRAVFDLMSDGQWHRATSIAGALGVTDSSVTARIRDFRKPKFGGHVVETRRVSSGDGRSVCWEYRLVVNGATCGVPTANQSAAGCASERGGQEGGQA